MRPTRLLTTAAALLALAACGTSPAPLSPDAPVLDEQPGTIGTENVFDSPGTIGTGNVLSSSGTGTIGTGNVTGETEGERGTGTIGTGN